MVDRAKDMIVLGGENAYSSGLENAIAQMSEVSTYAVIGVLNDTFGECVHTILVFPSGMTVTQEQERENCRELIASIKYPRSVQFRDRLPRKAAEIPVARALLRRARTTHQLIVTSCP